MQHVFYADGNSTKISWLIDTNGKLSSQQREHAQLYYDKVSDIQSKFIALHVGLFWAIGTFIIKNKDSVEIILDQKEMFDHLSSNKTIDDEFIKKRTGFINQLINQRKLEIKYTLDTEERNLAKIK
ncbi:hypothetical protein [Nitrosopumilus sp.]|uniref:hypothetical protein n=1 Tax=Nitrosopumilus sp. TaxID=2024843 RepID=UPI00262A14F4|nr:hypothetical protein [Nitrosopumilus sp.]